MKRALVLIVALGLAGCQELDRSVSPDDVPAPLASVQSGAAIPGQYIIVFRDGTTDAPGLAGALTQAHGGNLLYTYESALLGFAAQLPPPAVTALRNHPNVAYIEQDQVMYALGTQTNATWGLDRIDQRNRPLDQTYTYTHTGAGVRAYIIDTGIRLSHVDFGGRAVTGYDAVTADGTANDCNGHGTHVAGTVGGTVWGVAKAVRLYAVRVLNCNGSGTTSGVIAGVDWVTQNHIKPAVANMSLGGGASSTLDQAVQNSINAGIGYAIAAGNGDFFGRQLDACTQSPARVGAAMTISATNSNDAKVSWANYGNCVDFFAPGVSITSAWHSSNTATNTISGTSMAAPHVAGVAALYLQAFPAATPLQVRNALYDMTTKGIVTSSSTANNHLLYSPPTGFGSPPPPPPNAPPVAGFTYACTDLSCSFTDTSTDSDGSVVAWSWNFGDGATSTAQHPSRTYASGGTYTVSLTATDNQGATNTASQSVTVTAPASPPPTGITLSTSAFKEKGLQKVQLSWAGATMNVDIFRDGDLIAGNVANTGSYLDHINNRGGGSYTYRVCHAGSSTCSNEAVASF
jgi:subtilisin family serine protease